MTNPPTPQMPKPDIRRSGLGDIPPNATWFVDSETGTTTIEQFAQDMMDKAAKEKSARIYYQSIVYELCNIFDGQSRIVCGTHLSPSTELQERAKEKTDRVEELEKALRKIQERASYAVAMDEHRESIMLFEDMEAIEHEATKALTNPGEKGAEG